VPRYAVRPRILVVEDERMVRALVQQALTLAGCAVIAAADGIEALEAVDGRGESIALVVTDVVMPRLGGPALVAELRRTNPGLRALYLSGYPDRLPPGVGGDDVLEKPFSVDELVGAVRRLLEPPKSELSST
jgi:two-component system cell cycle sensor histidine kinase/response regulator CckA